MTCTGSFYFLKGGQHLRFGTWQEVEIKHKYPIDKKKLLILSCLIESVMVPAHFHDITTIKLKQIC